MYGKLVVHLTEYGVADINEIANKVAELIKDTDCKGLVKNFEVTRVCISTNAGMMHETGNHIRVKIQNRQNVAGAGNASSSYCYGTVGCFVKGSKRSSSEKMYALSCAHVFPEGCDSDVEIRRTELATKYDLFGKVKPKLKLLRKHTVDIAAIEVSEAAITKCNVKIKNSENSDAWENELHEGDLKSLVGIPVYKWGGVSYLTKGHVISTDYKTSKEEALDERFNIYVGSLPGSSECDFSRQGDSGSIICYDDPTEEKVIVLSLLTGPLTDVVTEKTVCFYSCHLQRNIQELTRKTDLRFELYD